MRQFKTFTRKEFLELLRTGRLWILLCCFVLFGIMSPALAKLTPWMIGMMSEQLAESGMVVTGVEVDAVSSWAQFYKNMPMMLILFLFLFGGIFTAEYQRGTLVNMVTKGMKRQTVLLSKTMVMVLVWTGGYLSSFWITYGYTVYFWGSGGVKHVFFAAFCLFMLGLWLISVISLASSAFDTSSAVLFAVAVCFLAAYLVTLFPAAGRYSPACLAGAAGLLSGGAAPADYAAALGVSGGLAAANVVLAVVLFRRKSI